MSIKEYLENLTRIKNLAVDRFGKLTTLEKEVVDSSFDWLVDNLEIKRGEVVVDEELSRIMNEFVKVVLDIVNNNQGFQSTLGKFLGDLKTIQDNNKKFHATTNNFNIDVAGVTDVQKAVVGEIIEQYVGNGLNQNFAGPLKDAVYRNILTGANMQDIKQVLQNYILSGADKSGKLQSYLHNTAIQAVDSYTGSINQKLAATFKFDGYIISGSLIETSSKQCIYAVETSEHGYLSFEDWEKVLDIARNNPKAKLIEGTTVKNLPLNKLHWGCRHDFTPVIKKKVEKPVDKKQEAKIEKKIDVQIKQEKGQPIIFGNAQSLGMAEKETSDIFRKNGFDVGPGSVTYADNISLAQANARNKQINRLFDEYEIHESIDKTKLAAIVFESKYRGTKSLGFVGTGKDTTRRELSIVNFGHTNDPYRLEQDFVDFSQPKSIVDKENLDISTPTHEFAHIISLDQQENYVRNDSKQKGFWEELLKVNREYNRELSEAVSSQDTKQEKEMFLGAYASVNPNEFMAEAFTEYKLRKEPSKYAKKVGLLIDKYFKK